MTLIKAGYLILLLLLCTTNSFAQKSKKVFTGSFIYYEYSERRLDQYIDYKALINLGEISHDSAYSKYLTLITNQDSLWLFLNDNVKIYVVADFVERSMLFDSEANYLAYADSFVAVKKYLKNYSISSFVNKEKEIYTEIKLLSIKELRCVQYESFTSSVCEVLEKRGRVVYPVNLGTNCRGYVPISLKN